MDSRRCRREKVWPTLLERDITKWRQRCDQPYSSQCVLIRYGIISSGFIAIKDGTVMFYFRFALNQSGSGGETPIDILRIVVIMRMLRALFVEVIFTSRSFKYLTLDFIMRSIVYDNSESNRWLTYGLFKHFSKPVLQRGFIHSPISVCLWKIRNPLLISTGECFLSMLKTTPQL